VLLGVELEGALEGADALGLGRGDDLRLRSLDQNGVLAVVGSPVKNIRPLAKIKTCGYFV